MFQYPYQTTPCQAYVLSGIVSALQHAAIDGQLFNAQTGKNAPIEGLFEVPPYVKSVAPFAHPLHIEVSGKPMLVVDTRAFRRADRSGTETRITNINEYTFLVLRGQLTKAWNDGHSGDLSSVGNIVPQVFVRLLSEGIVRKLGLNPMDQQYLSVVCAYYYFCQFNSQASIDEHTLSKYASRIAQITNINAVTVLQILNSIRDEDNHHHGIMPVLTDLQSLVTAIQRVGSSPRLASLNVGLIYASVTGVWFGANAREVVGVSLEYPPNFVALVYMALTDRSYHGAQFTKLVETCNKRDAGNEFIRNLANLLEMMSHA